MFIKKSKQDNESQLQIIPELNQKERAGKFPALSVINN
jgi:hypothetical protein